MVAIAEKVAVGFGRVGLGADVFQFQVPAGGGEGLGLVAGPIVHCLTGDCDAICRERGTL